MYALLVANVSSLIDAEAVGKTEARIVSDLLGSGLGQEDEALQRDLETWERSLEDLQRHKQEMVGQCSG